MRLVRLERQQSRVADDVRAALASLGRGSTVIGGIALVGVGSVTERPIEAVVLLPHGVIIVIGVDLPDPALRLEAPLGAPWKADGWPLIADDDAVNPATEALDISQACEQRIASLVPGTGPVGTIVAVGPYVETVDQPAADLAGPVRVLHPTPTTMLAATVSLATAHRPRSVDQVRALIRGLAPEAPEFSDEILLGEGFSRFTDDSPPESLWDSGPSVPRQPGRTTPGTAGSGGSGGSAGSAAAANTAGATGSAAGSAGTAAAGTDGSPGSAGSAAAAGAAGSAGSAAAPGTAGSAAAASPAAGAAGSAAAAGATAAATAAGSSSAKPTSDSANSGSAAPGSPTAGSPAASSAEAGSPSLGSPAVGRAGWQTTTPVSAVPKPAPAPTEDSEPAAIPATDSEAAEPAPTAASAEPVAPTTPAAEPAESAPPAAGAEPAEPEPAETVPPAEDSAPATGTAPQAEDSMTAGSRAFSAASEPDLADSSPHPGDETPSDQEPTETLPAPGNPLFPGATPQPQSREPGTDTERTEKLAFPTPPARTPRSAPRPVTLAQITLPPEPPTAGAPAPRPVPRETASTSKTVRWLPLGAIGLLVALVVAAIAVATSGDDTAAAPSGPPAPVTPPPSRTSAAPVRSLQFALRAADRDQRCASHAFGDAQASLQQTSCSGVRRASYAATVDGREAAVTVGIVEFPDAAQAGAFKAVADTPGGGGILDLASETGKWGATPAPRFENAAYTSRIEGTSVRVVQAVWAPGPSTADDPGLARAAKAALDLPAQ
ncbi:hypothetical protein [Amycolatopsis camponoti]|uniref:hypothetical protein n=1 Tax=Amycolatopsis camponoti TaxID=2606593 RepID=UPI001E4B35AF|nr:hypothetical protein [Amycolatopsis camponoti]